MTHIAQPGRTVRRTAAVLLLAVLTSARAAPPEVRAVSQRLNHCGVASTETILRAYGETAPWIRQNALALAQCVRIPEFRTRNPDAGDIQERYYPDFVETYQTILAEMLIDRGYSVVSTRASLDPKTKRPIAKVWDMLLGHIQRGRLAIIHVPGHYMVATGVDARRNELLFVDPARPGTTFRVSFDKFASGESFHASVDGSPRPGWDGRALILWKGSPINDRDTCPNCRRKTVGRTYRFCKGCRCFIDRRQSNHVQFALDTMAACCRLDDVTEFDESELRAAVNRLLTIHHYEEKDVASALRQYPLYSEQRESLLTLDRVARSQKIDVSALSVGDLTAIIAAKRRWPEVLQERMADAKRRAKSSDPPSEAPRTTE